MLPAFTMDNMENKALFDIQSTGIFSQAFLGWNGLLLENKTWSKMKYHLYRAYEAYLATGAGTSTHYIHANNVTEANYNDSLDTICNGFLC